MLKILPKITFGQNQTTTIPQKPTCAPTLERTPKHDCVSFGNNAKIALAKKYLERAEKLTLADNLMKPICSESNFYELPTNFFFAMQNTPFRHIIKKVPNALQNCGIPLDTALKKLDKIANLVRLTNDWVQYKSFKIGNKTIPIQKITPEIGGSDGILYRNKIGEEDFALKIFRSPKLVDSRGAWGEIAIARELAKADVKDVPKLYLASPHTHTGWLMSQFITEQTQMPTQGMSLERFLSKNGLETTDDISENFVLDSKKHPILVDLGRILPSGKTSLYFSRELRTKYMSNDFSSRYTQDEGTKIAALSTYLQKSLDENHEDAIASLNMAHAMQSPEGQLVNNIVNPEKYDRLNREQYASLLKHIDVIGDFQISENFKT